MFVNSPPRSRWDRFFSALVIVLVYATGTAIAYYALVGAFDYHLSDFFLGWVGALTYVDVRSELRD